MKPLSISTQYFIYVILALIGGCYLVFLIETQLIPKRSEISNDLYEQRSNFRAIILFVIFVVPTLWMLLKNVFIRIKSKAINDYDLTKNTAFKLDKKIKRNL